MGAGRRLSDASGEELEAPHTARKPAETSLSLMKYKGMSHTRSALLKELRALNVSAKELATEGHSLATLKKTGFAVKELLNAGFSLEELKQAQVTKKLKASGHRLADLKKAGYTLADFKEAGYSAKELRQASVEATEEGGDSTKRAMGYSVVDLKSAGAAALSPQAASPHLRSRRACHPPPGAQASSYGSSTRRAIR